MTTREKDQERVCTGLLVEHEEKPNDRIGLVESGCLIMTLVDGELIRRRIPPVSSAAISRAVVLREP